MEICLTRWARVRLTRRRSTPSWLNSAGSLGWDSCLSKCRFGPGVKTAMGACLSRMWPYCARIRTSSANVTRAVTNCAPLAGARPREPDRVRRSRECDGRGSGGRARGDDRRRTGRATCGRRRVRRFASSSLPQIMQRSISRIPRCSGPMASVRRPCTCCVWSFAPVGSSRTPRTSSSGSASSRRSSTRSSTACSASTAGAS